MTSGGRLGHTPVVLPISYAANVRALGRGLKHLVVVAPASTFKRKASKATLSKALGKRMADYAGALASEASPGRRGATASSLFKPPGSKSDGPSRLTVGVLPDSLSRYNSLSRADSIRHVVSQVALGGSGKVGVLLVLDDAAHLLAATNAVGRALPQFSRKAKPTRAKVQIAAITSDGTELVVDDAIKTVVDCARDSAELVDTPPSDLNPETYAVRIKEMLKEISGVKVTEIKGAKLLENGLGGIHAVGRGASTEPRMIVAEWNPKAEGTHVALVGKGVTFDTGGLHLKPRGGIEGMKGDMGGSAAVLGAFRVLTQSGYAGRLSLIMCIAENAVDERSFKPDDVLVAHSGKTVEINNTDAEGRLLLMDGLSWAARELGADVVFDAATLTGAQLISTGMVHAAVVTNDANLECAMVSAGKVTGDLVHPLIFAPELLQQEFSSKIADMKNSVSNRMNAQTSAAAQFLYGHIEGAPGAKNRRWCHIDLAGPSFLKGRGTGFGVALIEHAVRNLPEA